MKPKEKAEELIKSMDVIHYTKLNKGSIPVSMHNDQIKQCALICVDEILEAVTTIADKKYEYYQEVKTEIEKL